MEQTGPTIQGKIIVPNHLENPVLPWKRGIRAERVANATATNRDLMLLRHSPKHNVHFAFAYNIETTILRPKLERNFVFITIYGKQIKLQ